MQHVSEGRPSGVPTYEELKRRQGQECTLRYLASGNRDEPEIRGTLTTVGERIEQAGYERFALLLRATDESASPRQGIYSVAFPGGQVEEWFLVPVGQDSAGTLYEACFNRAPGTRDEG